MSKPGDKACFLSETGRLLPMAFGAMMQKIGFKFLSISDMLKENSWYVRRGAL